ncbi:MAG: hypothetical protein H5T73_11655 [Actinobacteria bacterium]|nr:hypothetical protein [Actinomycetota bacterium]
MCREGIDLVTLKVALRHSAERLQKEVDHLRQWTALASNANLAGVSARAAEACENIASGGELLDACVRELASMQVGGPPGGGGVTITPM